MRKKEDRLNPKTMHIESSLVLTCPRCSQEETLSEHRAYFTCPVTVELWKKSIKTGKRVSKSKKVYSFEDLCSKCIGQLLRWVQGADNYVLEDD